ncbi:cation:proton antiporter [Vibrio hippocampi]|uniref:K(+)/H(+) antiporter NhaP2 n=1 Tax=Vibrio hippocampi TaxID=654686 RepID=A0ABN8DNC5_9VIBR|nr:sodium:proton antiporter [Vibrio hippocampi]CAH0529469.1 K(+)/H(+) antiporter NhaP2 [Vibrio hippocampi]
MSSEMVALSLAAVGLLGLTCQWIAWHLKLPAILFLLLCGLLVGPVLGLFSPSQTLGELFFPFVSLAVAVILFEGSLTLNFKQIRGISSSVWSIISIGAIVSWVITSCAAHYLMGLQWTMAFLFGSLTVVTGPTVIVPLLRTVRPKAKLANILRWEGILIDPLGALFVVMVYEFLISQSELHSLMVLSIVVVVGFSLGIAAGVLVANIIKRHWLPEYLQPFAVLTILLAVFSLSNYIEHESGLLTVTVMGVWLANAKGVNIDPILHFKEHLTILFISGLFILLAARVELSDFEQLGWGALVLFAVIQLVSRPVSIFIATLKSNLDIKEKVFLSWVAPRGIVAAAVSSLFAIKLSILEVEQANLLVPLIFMVIIGTVILQSATARPIAAKLGVAEPAPRGFLIVGSNEVARVIGKAIQGYDCRVLMSDSNWDYVKKARMMGFDAYYGNPTSSHADEYLDMIGIGQVLALTPDQHFNSVASLQFANDFGERKVYSLQEKTDSNQLDKHRYNAEHDYRLFLDGSVSYKKLASLISQNAEIKHTKISEAFTFEDYQAQYKHANWTPLFVVDAKNCIHLVTDVATLQPKAGEIMVSLIKGNTPQ